MVIFIYPISCFAILCLAFFIFSIVNGVYEQALVPVANVLEDAVFIVAFLGIIGLLLGSIVYGIRKKRFLAGISMFVSISQLILVATMTLYLIIGSVGSGSLLAAIIGGFFLGLFFIAITCGDAYLVLCAFGDEEDQTVWRYIKPLIVGSAVWVFLILLYFVL